MNYENTLRIYIAGKLDDGAINYILNLRKMILAAEEVKKLGCAVYVPGMDFLQGVVLGYTEYSDYFDNGQPWLTASHAVYIHSKNWSTSNGTKKEKELAERLGIPVFFELENLKQFIQKWKEDHST